MCILISGDLYTAIFLTIPHPSYIRMYAATSTRTSVEELRRGLRKHTATIARASDHSTGAMGLNASPRAISPCSMAWRARVLPHVGQSSPVMA